MSLAWSAVLLAGAGWGMYELSRRITGSVKAELREGEREKINKRVIEANARDIDTFAPGSRADRADQEAIRRDLQEQARQREVKKAKEAQAAKKADPPKPASEYGTHTVSAGENLTGIAQRYRTTPFWLAQLNGLPNRDAIRVGQVLKVPRLARTDDQGRTIPQGNEYWGEGR